MRRLLGLLVVLGLLAGGAPGQIPQHSVGTGTDLRVDNSYLRWFGSQGLPLSGLEALYTMGPDGDPTLNPGTKWYDRAENLLLWSADLSEWTASGTPVVTATTVEDDDGAGYEYILQSVTAPDATIYTWSIWVLKDAVAPATRFPRLQVQVFSSYTVHLDTQSGATTEGVALGGSHSVVSDGDYWKLSLTFTTDDGNGIIAIIYPAAGANADLTSLNAAAVGEITILRQQLTPGTSSGTYRKTEARQRVWDWGPNGLPAQVGSGGGVTTNDPGDALIDPGDPTIIAARGDFDGVDDYNAVSSVPFLDSFTIIALLKEDGRTGFSSIVVSTNPAWGTARSFAFASQTGVGKLYIKTATSGEESSTVGTLGVGEWACLAGTYDGAQIVGYLDGSAGTPTAVTGAMSGSKDLSISTAGTPWDGTIALVAVYSRAISAAENVRFYKTVARSYCNFRGILCDVFNINPWSSDFDASFGVGP